VNAPTHDRNRLRTIVRASALLTAAGVAGLAIGGVLAPERLWANALLALFLLAGFGLAGLLFLAFHYLTGARWSEPLRPLAERLAGTLAYTTPLLGLTIALGLRNYPWMHEDLAAHPTFWFKAAWLSPTFFLMRAAAILLIWVGFAAAMVRSSRRCESPDPAAAARRNSRLSAAFLIVFAFTFWLATTDWIMSLEPLWYSTIFAVYHFAGAFLGGLAMLALLAVGLRRRGALGETITARQRHDLGKLIFGFSCFWMYIWFCQYMLIWYANIPEETVHFVRRTEGLWGPLFLLNLALNWAIPFLVLLPRAAKRSEHVLARVALVLLAGRWLDMYLSIAPPLVGDSPLLGFAEVGAFLAAIGGGSLLLALAFRAGEGAVTTESSAAPEAITWRPISPSNAAPAAHSLRE
jgi:hypothetical protein